MNVVLLRVGIDTGCGGIHSPLFRNGTFDFVPIPDSRELDERTYGSLRGRTGRVLAEYFPERRREQAMRQPVHFDPEFDSFTYGDPTPPKRSLANLEPGDLLVFYAGMQGCDHICPPALYLAGMFRVELVGFASSFSREVLRRNFRRNFHVRHAGLFAEQREKLVLVKGGNGSRLFKRAHLFGEQLQRENRTFWQFITPSMRKIFGTFGGIGSVQRSTPRWVEDQFIERAEEFVETLE